MTPLRTLAVLLSLVMAANARAQSAKDAGWGEPVDGIACRLTLKKDYVVGQTISATLEIKNTSDKKRYLVPFLHRLAIDFLAIEITGPTGIVKQISPSVRLAVTQSSYKPILPGEIMRQDVIDLRDDFGDLAPGKYTARFRFRNPKPPVFFEVLEKPDKGKINRIVTEVSDEIKAGAWADKATSNTAAFDIEFLWRDNLIVHEWGVFTVFNDVKYANTNRKQEWGSLPSFFYRQFPTQRLRWMPSGWDKPIIYFYAKRTPMKINVKVSFGDIIMTCDSCCGKPRSSH